VYKNFNDFKVFMFIISLNIPSTCYENPLRRGENLGTPRTLKTKGGGIFVWLLF
jgi:hypothetical protein